MQNVTNFFNPFRDVFIIHKFTNQKKIFRRILWNKLKPKGNTCFNVFAGHNGGILNRCHRQALRWIYSLCKIPSSPNSTAYTFRWEQNAIVNYFTFFAIKTISHILRAKNVEFAKDLLWCLISVGNKQKNCARLQRMFFFLSE